MTKLMWIWHNWSTKIPMATDWNEEIRSLRFDIRDQKAEIARLEEIIADRFDIKLKMATEIANLRELKMPASRALLNITKALLDDANAEIARLQELLRGVGANRYWEGRWCDANAEIARLQAALDETNKGVASLSNETYRLRAALEIAKDALQRNTGNYSFVLDAIDKALVNEERQ